MSKPETSQARIDANRRNSLKSTGPTSEVGKSRSRRNSLIHGLASKVVRPEAEETAINAIYSHWHSSINPKDNFDEGLLLIVATEYTLLERCRAEERVSRDQLSRHAEANWHDERKADVEVLARKLNANPAEVAMRLSATSQGCDWLIARWELLGQALEETGGWTETQKSIAYDLMGIAPDLRKKADHPDAPKGEALKEHRREVVEGEIHRLTVKKIERLDDLDAEQRDAMIAGLDITNHPALKCYRRYESTSLRRIEWAINLILRRRQEPAPSDDDRKKRKGETPRGRFDIARPPRGHDGSQEHYPHGLPPESRAESNSKDPFGLSAKMAHLFPTSAVQDAEQKLYGLTSERFSMSDRAAKRERQRRDRVAVRAAHLEQQRPRA